MVGREDWIRGISGTVMFTTVSSLLLLGCSLFSDGECEKGETRCSGNVLEECIRPCSEPGCGLRWEGTDCGQQECVVPRGMDAVCATSPVEDPNCDNASYCSGNEIVRCIGQYAVDERLPCGSEGCVEDAEGAECRVPFDPHCAAGRPFVCDGRDSLMCETRRIVSRTTCADVCEVRTGLCE